jgi:hypothetical protein
MMKFLLFLIAVILSAILIPIGLVFSFITRLFVWKFRGWRRKLGDYFYICAVSIDQTGNVFCSDLFNAILIKQKESTHLFGNADQTISAVLGYNDHYNTISKLGKYLVKLLDFFDAEHCEVAMLVDMTNKVATIEILNKLKVAQEEFEKEVELKKQKEDELKQKPNTRRSNKVSNRQKEWNRQQSIKRRNSKPKTGGGEDLPTSEGTL